MTEIYCMIKTTRQSAWLIRVCWSKKSAVYVIIGPVLQQNKKHNDFCMKKLWALSLKHIRNGTAGFTLYVH